MEVLKTDPNIPNLITNFEVLYILTNLIEKRTGTKRGVTDEEEDENEEGNIKKTKKNSKTALQKKLQHRDFIEEKVFQYLQEQQLEQNISHPSMQVTQTEDVTFMDPDLTTHENRRINERNNTFVRMSRFVEILITQDGKTFKAMKVNKLDGDEFLPTNLMEQQQEDEEMQGFGLTNAEALQILNLMPKELVELHLIIEDLSNRLEETRQLDLLRLIQKYSSSLSKRLE